MSFAGERKEERRSERKDERREGKEEREVKMERGKGGGIDDI